jgi:protein-tyrosine-phosphatase
MVRDGAGIDRQHGRAADERVCSLRVGERLKQMNLDIVAKTADVITTERQFRTILGLHSAAKRRIVPTTKPTKDHIVFDWDASLSEMKEEQPDICQQQAIVRLAELQLLLARNQCIHYVDEWTVQQLIDLGPELESPQQVSLTRFRQSMRPLVHRKSSGYLGLGADRDDYRNFLKRPCMSTSRLDRGDAALHVQGPAALARG